MVEITGQDLADKLKELSKDFPEFDAFINKMLSGFGDLSLIPLTGSYLEFAKMVMKCKTALEASARVEHWNAKEATEKVTFGKIYLRMIDLGAPETFIKTFGAIVAGPNRSPLDRIPESQQRSGELLLKSRTFGEFKANAVFLAQEEDQSWKN